MSSENPNRLSEIDIHFIEGGAWEKKGGREMSRHFADSFVKHVRIPLREPFSFLDMGCALGDSLPVFHSAYPQALLAGCDVSANAVRRCLAEHGQYASFFQSSINELAQRFDVVFCSNLIEHVENHVEIVNHLTTLAKIVYVMVPYMELHNGQRLNPKFGMWHVATFDEHSFDSLKDYGLNIRTFVFRCPGAWGYPIWKIPLAKAKAYLLNRTFIDKKQIVYELSREAQR